MVDGMIEGKFVEIEDVGEFSVRWEFLLSIDELVDTFSISDKLVTGRFALFSVLDVEFVAVEEWDEEAEV